MFPGDLLALPCQGSRLAACIGETRADIEAPGLLAPIVGHVGDGNNHVIYLLDPQKPDEFAEAERLNERMAQRAIAVDGTCTGEHGVGLGKRKYLAAEYGEEAVDLMRTLKRALDLDDILNPGKMVPG